MSCKKKKKKINFSGQEVQGHRIGGHRLLWNAERVGDTLQRLCCLQAPRLDFIDGFVLYHATSDRANEGKEIYARYDYIIKDDQLFFHTKIQIYHVLMCIMFFFN